MAAANAHDNTPAHVAAATFWITIRLALDAHWSGRPPNNDRSYPLPASARDGWTAACACCTWRYGTGCASIFLPGCAALRTCIFFLRAGRPTRARPPTRPGAQGMRLRAPPSKRVVSLYSRKPKLRLNSALKFTSEVDTFSGERGGLPYVSMPQCVCPRSHPFFCVAHLSGRRFVFSLRLASRAWRAALSEMRCDTLRGGLNIGSYRGRAADGVEANNGPRSTSHATRTG